MNMKKQLILIVGFVCVTNLAFGGGIVTNTNQSAAWVRTMVRDASTDVDAIYYNPAGLIKLNDGFHFSLNNQFLFQNKDVTDNYQFLNPSPKKYHGAIKALIFPGVYGVWKKGRFAVSAGFNPVGGGGGAEFKTGLPSFEASISDLVPMLQVALAPLDAALSLAQPAGYGFDPGFRNITGYNADIYFNGTSVYLGYQLGASFKINDFIGVFAGARYVTAKNTYEGHIKNVQIEASPTDPPQPLYDVPAGSYAPGEYLRAVGGAFGLPAAQVAVLNGYADALDAATVVEADAEETGAGYTPILGANISIGENLNIGLKYEFKTILDLKQKVIDGKDGGGIFVQDSTVHSDMPAMVSAGVTYQIIPKLSASAGFHYFFDRSVNFGKTLDSTEVQVDNDMVIDKNTYEIALGLEYDINEKLLISGGYLFSKSGVSEDYQSDMSFDLSSSTFGIGICYKFNENLKVDVGGAYTMYNEGEKNYMHSLDEVGFEVPGKYSYFMDNIILGIGVEFGF